MKESVIVPGEAIELPLLPLRGILVFPYMVIHLDVGREKSVKAIDEAMLKDRHIFLATQKEAQTDEPSEADIYAIGTIAEVKQLLKLPGGTIRVLVEGLARAEIQEYVDQEPFFSVKVMPQNDVTEKTPEVEALMRNLLSSFEQYVKVSKKIPPETVITIVNLEEPARLADIIASHLPLKVEEKQQILEAVDVMKRLEILAQIVAKELEIVELERKISVRVRKQMEKTQKEYYLREQIKAIQKELGEKEDRVAEAEEFRKKIAEANLPEYVEEKALKEVDRLEKMPPMVAESAVVRNYLDWILALPWSVKTKDRIDINIAEKILNEDHYGLDKVKERILEFLAIRKLAKKLKGPILCLVGPPGVGKTSLVKSIARALKRKYIRMSLGGVRDEAEIRGHRRTYVGAMPGRIVQGMKTAGSNNPVVCLDEIDKMSSDFRGDPASALLEVLDPEQNNTFSDHFMEIPFDLSNVMFITTANSLHTIPRPLLDRMEVIHISGYTEEEKLAIAKRYLVPKQLKEHGLKPEQCQIPDETLYRVIREYTKESGVRSLERQVGSLCRKVAKEIVRGTYKEFTITPEQVESLLGIPRFRYGVAEKQNQVGLVMGMAWTEVGGDTLAIEVATLPGKGRLTLTGKLGDVMKESAQAGYTYIRSKVDELGIDHEFHEKLDLHVHVPEGAIPKDGPSAGITMATAIASALSKKAVYHDIAMTGEITLRGRVLPVGGIKEKILAAHRAGIKRIILPAENRKDLEDVPENVKKELEFFLVEHMDEVLPVALVSEQNAPPTEVDAAPTSKRGRKTAK